MEFLKVKQSLVSLGLVPLGQVEISANIELFFMLNWICLHIRIDELLLEEVHHVNSAVLDFVQFDWKTTVVGNF